jgi:predicted extracellular nuclease
MRLLAGACAAGAFALWSVPPAIVRAAAPTDLFISEYIEGTGNNKALEIFNGTGAAINLATGGYNVQMFFNGATAPGLTINLTGTVANGDVFVVAQGLASAAILAQADQTNGAGWFNGDDYVVLRKGTAVIDAIGQVGVDPGTEWGTGLTSTADNTLSRKPTACAGDTIGTDAFDPAAEWDGFAIDTISGLGSYTTTCTSDLAPTVTSTFPVNGATNFPVAADLTVTFSEPVNASTSAFSLSCSLSGSVSLAVSGGPTTFTLNPAVDLKDHETCTLTVIAAQVSDQDLNDPPNNMVANFTTGFSAFDVCQAPFTPIASIQGSGLSAAIVGTVTTSGVVVGDFEGPEGIGGFYLQDPQGDGDPATSDGIFVYTASANTVANGDRVRVTGFARERFNQTTINGSNSNTAAVPATAIVKCGTGSVTATDFLLPFTSADSPEPYEGMLVRLPQALTISEYFNFDRFGEIVLGLPRAGESRLMTPTAVENPGAAANVRAADNRLRQIVLDDGLGIQNPPLLRHPDGSAFSLANRFRGGDTVQNVVGVVGFDFSVYRIQPTEPADYVAVNHRAESPHPVGGSLRVASINTLNFFLTLDYPTGDPRDNKCGPLQNVECRGADADQPDEFQRQRDKLVAAVASLDADVVGLNELENTPTVDPLNDPAGGIVSGVNASVGAGTYASIDTGVVGTDAIRVGMIYKPARVAPVGAFATLDSTDDPRFIDTRNRPSLAQSFEVLTTGARFTVVVNHLKSKGSDCADIGDPDTGDGQGNCNLTRTAAAAALMDWIATDPTGSGDADVLIVGDLNSYAKEDPVVTIERGSDGTPGSLDDFTNLVLAYEGAGAYSYVFDAQAGYLDHALSSQTLTPQVTGATEFHINADEPDVIDYDTTFKPPQQEALYEPNGFRASDHDPVVVGLDPIHYAFSGFHRLAFDSGVFNPASAGSSVPVKFSLGGYQGLDLFRDGYPRSFAIACDGSSATSGDGLPTVNPGASALSYDRTTDQYNYVWKTDRAWRGTCRRLVVTLKDGAVHYVNVLFK